MAAEFVIEAANIDENGRWPWAFVVSGPGPLAPWRSAAQFSTPGAALSAGRRCAGDFKREMKNGG